MRTVFDRPTRFTLNSLFVRRAEKDRLVATVEYRSWAGKGTPAAKYIGPNVDGGERAAKGFERKLQSGGLLATGKQLIPTSAVKLDAFGNPIRGQYSKIMSALAVQADKSSNSRGDKAKSAGMFWGNPHGLGRGVWQRFKLGHGWALKPLFLEIGKAKYRKLLPFVEVQKEVMRQWFSVEFKSSMEIIASRWKKN